MVRFFVGCLFFLVMASGAVRTGTASGNVGQPILQLETGGHVGIIRDMAFTPDGQYLVSAADDKLIRVWDMQTRKTVRIIRGQVGKGHPGEIFGMALSPDGRWIAVGGWLVAPGRTGYHIRLYDFRSGKLVALLHGHTSVVLSLAFSPDSGLLVSGGSDKNAIVWDIGALDRRLEDRGNRTGPAMDVRGRYQLPGHKDRVFAVGFIPLKGRFGESSYTGGEEAGFTTDDEPRGGYNVVTGSFDHTLRLWGLPQGGETGREKPRLIKVLRGHRDKVRALSISPRDGTIASGSWDHTVRLWDGRTGKALNRRTVGEMRVGSLGFSPDGKFLLVGCGGGKASCSTDHEQVLRIGADNSIGSVASYKGHDSLVLATIFSPDGRWAVTGGGRNREIHFWNPRTGKRKEVLKGTGATIWSAGFTRDGRYIGWGRTYTGVQATGTLARSSFEYQLRLPSQEQGLGKVQKVLAFREGGNRGKPPYFTRAKARHGAYSLKTRKGGGYGFKALLDIQKNGRTIRTVRRGSSDGYDHRAYSFSPDGRMFVSGGGNGVLGAFTRSGKKIGNFIGHTNVLWATTFSPDGRLLLSAGSDQTVRLWNARTRELVVTLFHGAPQKSGGGAGGNGEWAMWTPQGYYTASKNGRSLVGWQLNRGATRAAGHHSGAQLHKYLYSPEIISRAIVLGSARRAVKEQGGKNNILQKVLASGAPPKILITSEDDEEVTGETVTVEAQALTQGGGIGKVEWRVNGITLGVEEDNLEFVGQGRGANIRRSFTLDPGKNRIELVVYNKQGWIASKPQVITRNYSAAFTGERPSLHMLSIGVNDYWDSKLRLNYAVPDANALADAFEKGGKKLYRSVHVTRLLDKDVNVAKLEETFRVMGKKIRPGDVFVFFVAGHGVTRDGQYYYLPQDVRISNLAELKRKAVSQDMWQRWFAMIPARKSILLYDTCESGTMTTTAGARRGVSQIAAIERLIHATGRAVISATTDDTPALEGYGGHGLFTYALLEGLARGDANGDGLLELTELTSHVDRRVPEISHRHFNFRQVPRFDLNGMNYSLSSAMPGLVKGGGGTNISRKPSHVVIMSATVLASPENGAKKMRELTPGTLVTQVKEQGDWMLVGKDGRKLGYIRKSALVPVQ